MFFFMFFFYFKEYPNPNNSVHKKNLLWLEINSSAIFFYIEGLENIWLSVGKIFLGDY